LYLDMSENMGQLVSRFVAERVDDPCPEEVEVWSHLVYAGLFSSGFVVWLPIAKASSSQDHMRVELSRLVDEIAKDADLWMGSKICQALRIADSNISVHAVPEIRFHLLAMFDEAIAAIAEGKLTADAARSSACFVHLQANLRRLALVGKVLIDVQSVLKQGIDGCDAMASEIQAALKTHENKKHGEQMKTVILPKGKVSEARDKVIASLNSGSRREQQMAYLKIVETISHPAAIFRGRCVKGTRRLQYFLNGIIIVRRTIYIVLLILGIFLSKWWFLGLPLWLISDLWIINWLQTCINVELVSRLIVLDNLMDEDEDFRSRALAALGNLGTPSILFGTRIALHLNR
jgi:hypothetical protein